MNKTSKVLASILLVSVAAFGVSACKWPGAKDKDPVATAPASGDVAPAAPDASATPPASGAVAPDTDTAADTASAAPTSAAAVSAAPAKPGKKG